VRDESNSSESGSRSKRSHNYSEKSKAQSSNYNSMGLTLPLFTKFTIRLMDVQEEAEEEFIEE
jgi:hypothetical protein